MKSFSLLCAAVVATIVACAADSYEELKRAAVNRERLIIWDDDGCDMVHYPYQRADLAKLPASVRNFKLVFLLIQKLEEKVPGICSGIALRKTPYNQGLAPNSLLVEVGFEGNLVSEAQRSAEVLAEDGDVVRVVTEAISVKAMHEAAAAVRAGGGKLFVAALRG